MLELHFGIACSTASMQHCRVASQLWNISSSSRMSIRSLSIQGIKDDPGLGSQTECPRFTMPGTRKPCL